MYQMNRRSALPAALALAMIAQPLPLPAQHNHAAHAHVTQPVPVPAPRWVADATLRDGMGRIHAALRDLRNFDGGRMDGATALERVDRIERAAADIFAKCRLAPEQDAVLHGILIPLLGATQRFKEGTHSVQELEAMRKAVAGYPRYFNDPGWLRR